jgi:DNA-binding response OmpR family regulator
MTETATVLIVDDDTEVARTYRRYLDGEYDVRAVNDGESALDAVDGADVVILDRRMPGLTGRETLARIRERGVDCRVAMVTAVDADFDVVEMGFDAYVTKPVSRAELQSTVEELLSLDRYADEMREYHSLLARRAALQEGKLPAELDDSEAYAEVERRITDLGATLDAGEADLTDDTTFVAALRAIEGGHGPSEGNADG